MLTPKTDAYSIDRDVSRLALVAHNEDELGRCLDHALASSRAPSELSVISIAEIGWVEGMSLISGYVVPENLVQEAMWAARAVALDAMRMLPRSVSGEYIVCGGWADPCLRRYLLTAHYDQLIVAGKRWRCTTLGRWALRGTGTKVVTVARSKQQRIAKTKAGA